jgi:hypothetical protein
MIWHLMPRNFMTRTHGLAPSKLHDLKSSAPTRDGVLQSAPLNLIWCLLYFQPVSSIEEPK